MEYHSAVNFRGDVYLFGGSAEDIPRAAVYKFTGTWERIQDMAMARMGHRSVVNGDSIYHIGGNRNWLMYEVPYEEWLYNENDQTFTVTISDTVLDDYYTYPETFIVNEEDYSNCT